MRKTLFSMAFLGLTLPGALAADPDLGAIVDDHILTGYGALARESAALAEAAQSDCGADNPPLQDAYHSAFDAWISVSHLRFGPSDDEDRAFALAFWPDTRGKTPKALLKLLTAEEPVTDDLAQFQKVSIAARGFYALEFLLYDPQIMETGTSDARCQLVRIITRDIADLSGDMLADWQAGYADQMRTPTADGPYRTEAEAQRQLFTALTTGLEFTANMRVGRPMGTFERPRPKRAEARRSGRALRNITLSLEATRALALMLADDTQAEAVEKAYAKALKKVADFPGGSFDAVTDAQTRFKAEVMQQDILAIKSLAQQQIGPSLGIEAGFNSLDGD